MARTPYPLPFGWFAVAWSDEVVAARSAPFECLGRQLVAWRDDVGTPVVAEVGSPRRFEAVDRNGAVLVWYHPDPTLVSQWEIPVVDELGDEAWFDPMRTVATIDNHVQELAENQVDTAHFRFVHSNATVPVIEEYEPGFPNSRMVAKQFLEMPEGEPVPGRLDITSVGPGMSIVRFDGLVETLDVAYTTPISLDRTMIRSQFRVRSLGDEALTAMAANAFAAEVHRQMVEEDGPIWAHKAHIARPALADGDGPVLRFRSWFRQFYAEEPEADGRWEPPWWPERAEEAPAGRVERGALALDLAPLRAE